MPSPSRDQIESFLACRRFAFIGASRRGGFGNRLMRALRSHQCEVCPVHPEAVQLDGLPTAHSLQNLTGRVEALVVALPAPKVPSVLQEAAAAGIRRVWIQQGGSSPETARLVGELGLEAVDGACLMMYLPHAAGVHRLHRRIQTWIERRRG